ncbi:MAG: HAMP domain-containing histidine kinase [Ignavibacteriales bacterium]|nr:MAG: HAMP domain-containing histidine kinase [Ignavibacteriales bacterium]
MKLKERSLWIITSLISVSVLGLILIQLYLLNIVVEQKEESFKQNVINTLKSVSSKLETKEARNLVFNYVSNNEHNVDTIHTRYLSKDLPKDSVAILLNPVRLPLQGEKMKIKDTAGYFVSGIFVNEDSIIHSKKFSKSAKSDSQYFNFSFSTNDTGKTFYRYRYSNDSIKFFVESEDGKDLTKALQNINKQHRKVFITEIVDKLTMIDLKPIDKRVSSEEIDSLLSDGFNNAGIDIDYEFGVLSGFEDSLKLFFSKNNSDELKNSPFRTELFQADVLPFRNILVVDFPGSRFYVLRQSAPLLILSLLFVGLIIWSFTFTIKTIYKQKRFSASVVSFINNMTHEFKTPLSSISLASEAIGKPEVSNNIEKLNRYNQIIKDENTRMKKQVEKILEMSVLEEGDYELNLTNVDVHDILIQAVNNASLQVEPLHGKIISILEADKHFIPGDVVHISNIFHNVIDNAIKYSKDKPEIKITTSSDSDFILISISDNGIGVSEENTKRVFEKYYRVPTGNIHNVKGFGLGLSYVKLMVEAHNGEVRFSSNEGTGSTVEIKFPLINEQ